MPDPKRYAAKTPWYAIETFEHPIGEFVLYADYAKLKKEFNDWITMNSATAEHNEKLYDQAVAQNMAAIVFKNRCTILEADIARLKQESERLTGELEELKKPKLPWEFIQSEKIRAWLYSKKSNKNK